MSSYDSTTGTYKFKAWIILNGGLQTLVHVWARTQQDARRLVQAQYTGCHIVGISVQIT